jgi:hypothetical protein
MVPKKCIKSYAPVAGYKQAGALKMQKNIVKKPPAFLVFH